MKKGILILTALATLSLILIKPINVNATEQNNWAALLPINGRIDYKSCTSATECNTSFESNVPGYIDTTYGSREFVINTNAMTIGQNGYNIMSPITNMKKNYLYSIEFYLCSNKVLTDTTITPEIYSGWYSDAGKNDDIYSTTARMSLSGYPGNESGAHFNYCYLYTGLVVPDRDSTWANFRIRKTGSALSGVYISTISINYRELGLYNTALEEIIKNSGFATADSVEQVQQSVTKIEDEITGEFETPTTPSETIPGKDKIDETKEIEEEILNNLDFGAIDNLNITINPNVSTFIWEVVEKIRNINSKIILLITSMIGLGLIKMILNR